MTVITIFKTGGSTTLSRYKQQANTASYAASAEKEIEQRCLNLEPPRMAECIRGIIEATNEHNRDEDDLVAQTDMAWWAFWMVIVSVGSAGVTVVGIYFVWRTLNANTAAVVQASRANDIAEQTRLDVGRPFVFIENIGTNIDDILNAPALGSLGGWVNWSFNIRHYGEMPAVIEKVHAEVFVSSDVRFTDGEWTGYEMYSKNFGWDNSAVRTIVPIVNRAFRERIKNAIPLDRETILSKTKDHEPFTVTGKALSPDYGENNIRDHLAATRNNIQRLENFLWLYVVVFYKDAYGRDHITSGCYKQTHHFNTISEAKGSLVNYRT